MNTVHRKPLPGTRLDYFDARAAVDFIQPGAYAKLPYTSRVLAENLVRRCDPPRWPIRCRNSSSASATWIFRGSARVV
jgi:aconitase A